MNLLTRLRSWLKWVVNRQRLETDLEAEVRFHIDSYAADLVRSGVPASEAVRRARIEFGGIESHKDAVRASMGLRWWDDLWNDVQYGARILRKSHVYRDCRGVAGACDWSQYIHLFAGKSTSLCPARCLTS